MLTISDSLLLIGLAMWIVYAILSAGMSDDEAADETYRIGLIGLVTALIVLGYKLFLG